MEIQEEYVKKGSTVLVCDDLLATGGTIETACKLLKQCGTKPAYAFVIFELSALNGRAKIPEEVEVKSLITFD